MRKRHCAGCGAAEPENASPHRIVPVHFAIEGDQVRRSWESEESYEEDVCSDCVRELLSRFFGVKVEGDMTIPVVLRRAV